MELKNASIVITGGAGGIGSFVSEQLVKEGAKVIIVDRGSTQSSIESVTYIRGDLSNSEGIGKVCRVLSRIEPDVLINLAGIQYFGELGKQTPEQIIFLYNVNLLAPVLLTQAVLASMKKKNHGQIVNIGSTFGSIHFAHFVSYSSSKAGLRAFSEALRRELAETKVGVSYIAPRAVKTPLNSPLILKLAKQINMKMDNPLYVARRIVAAIRKGEKEVYLGFPESLFVRINGLFPRFVDKALAKNDSVAKQLLILGG